MTYNSLEMLPVYTIICMTRNTELHWNIAYDIVQYIVVVSGM